MSPPAPAAPGSEYRVALGHDYLLVLRGAERTFAAMADLYPQAPIHSLLYDEEGTGGRFSGRSVQTSPLQRLGVGQASFRRLLPLYPWATGRLRPSDCDVVLTSSSAFAQGIEAPAEAIHICYSHTPFRYAWYEEARALSEIAPLLRPLLRQQLRRMRRWDLAASRRVHAYLANSRLTQERLRQCYGRESVLVHPPVETSRFRAGEPGDYLLVVSEIVRHKRIQIALEGARRAKAPIKIVGSGPDFEEMRSAYPEADFLGRASDEDLVELYAGARAVIVPSREEFGITAVEAQAAGRPVIAANAGGALETVVEGETGLFATFDDAGSFAEAIGRMDSLELDPARAQANAQRFSVDAFQERLGAEVQRIASARGSRPQLL